MNPTPTFCMDSNSGAAFFCGIFIAVLGASYYICAETTLTQLLPDWLVSHVRAFEYF